MRIVILILVLCVSAPLREAQSSPRPNIVLLFADDMGYSDIGCFGSLGVRIGPQGVPGTKSQAPEVK